MSIIPFVYLFINIACVGALIYLVVLLFPHRHIPATKAFLFLAGLLIFWSITLTNQTTLVFSANQVIFMHRLAESVFLFIPVALILLVDTFATVTRLMRKWVYILFGAAILLFLALIWTNQYHHLFWSVENVVMAGNKMQIVAQRTLFARFLSGLQHLEIVFSAFHFLGLTVTLNQAYRKLTRLINACLILTAVFSTTPLLNRIDSPYRLLPLILTLFTFSLAHLIVNHNIFDLALTLRTTYFDQLADGALIVATTGTIIDVSKQFIDQAGQQQVNAMIGEDMFSFFPQWETPFAKVLETHENQATSINYRKDGEEFQYDVIMHANKDMYGFVSTVLIKLQDVTFYRQLLNQVNELAIRDPLTGILNRRHFELLVLDHLKLAQRYHRAGCLLMIDLDDFKHINDFYGHQIGDKVLSEFCRGMNQLMRDSDIFARYGGDEFLLYLPETDLNGALTVIQHLRKYILGTMVEIDDVTVALKCSIGGVPINFQTVELPYQELIRQADKAMYAAKSHSPNVVGMMEYDQVTFHFIEEKFQERDESNFLPGS